MYLIQNITTDPAQGQTITLNDGTNLSFILTFYPMQYGWFFTNLTYGSLSINGLRVTNSPNMLRQWQNLIPFGMACYTAGNREPTQQQDFSSGASNLYILTSAEVQQYSEFLNG